MIITVATINTMEILTCTAMIMAHKVVIRLKDMTILTITMTTDIHTIISMTTTLPIVIGRTINTTALTDTVIPIFPPALTERR